MHNEKEWSQTLIHIYHNCYAIAQINMLPTADVIQEEMGIQKI